MNDLMDAVMNVIGFVVYCAAVALILGFGLLTPFAAVIGWITIFRWLLGY